jgi:cobalt-zinc-cadmium efflux system membrane fusion protein
MNDREATTARELPRLSRFLSSLAVIGILGAGWLAVHQLETGQTETLPGDSDVAEASEQVLALTLAKVEAVKVVAEPIERRKLQHLHTVPGRIRYDESKHVAIQAPIAGILVESLVMPGQRVEAGQLLAVIQSAEIGEARADVLAREAELTLIERQSNWQHQITSNLSRLFSELESGKSIDEVHREYAEKPLGQYRDQLLSAWSKKLLADQLAGSARPLAAQGSIATRTLQERETERQVAEAALRTVRDMAGFESRQQRDQLLNELADAQRRVTIARNHLETLLGYAEQQIPTDNAKALSRLELRAPFSGTIESRSFAVAERLARQDSLFVLADTSTLYVAASIRENDWPAVQLQPGQRLSVSAPAVPERAFEATVHYVGRQVDVESNAVPLVATIDNRDALLRPGMFVRVSVPMGQPREAIAVPARAVMQHENEEFVFVAMNDRTFRRVDIVTGMATDEWVEVLSGLQPGERVVDAGAFLLKSELLLEGEEE